MYILNFHFGYFSLLNGDSEESVRCSYCSVLNVNENDLRISFENTCTDSLVTAFDDEALLICDQGTEMARAKVLFVLVAQGSYIHTLCTYIFLSGNSNARLSKFPARSKSLTYSLVMINGNKIAHPKLSLVLWYTINYSYTIIMIINIVSCIIKLNSCSLTCRR